MLKKKIIIGARGSLLSVTQAQEVSRLLKGKFPHLCFSLKKLVTFGDKHRNWHKSRHCAQGRDLDTGIFVKEIEEALLCGKIDLAVHSLKDLPCVLPKGLELAAVPKRHSPQDCIIFKGRKINLLNLRKDARIGTSSLRRKAQILYWRADLQVENLRGNLDTRLEKLNSAGFDAIVVALAGVKRLGFKNLFTPPFLPDNIPVKGRAGFIQIIPTKLMLPAPGQGALGIEIRQGDTKIKALVEKINHCKSFLCVRSERAFLKELGAGCRLPLGALAEIEDGKIHLEAVVASPDGKRLLRLSKTAPLDKSEGSGLPSDRQSQKAEALGKQLAHQMLKKGAGKLLKEDA